MFGDLPRQARVLQPGVPLRGALHSTALGEESQQARALHGTVLGEVPQQARALNGTVLGDVSQHARALRGRVLGDLPQRDRALQAGSSSGATLQRIDLGGDLVECEGKDLWEWVQCRRHGNLHGGGNGSKADLPELPCEATPLQFGDWLYLCGPIMKNLESPRRWR